ncbi:MAG: hypothetical protein JW940_33005 [Polyangiaceae bacterium]|nr:hypothetical protein [Polyangiaceae bacterium]
MSNHRSARRKRATRRRSRRSVFEPFLGDIRTFTVGHQSIASITIGLGQDSRSPSAGPDHDCPYCQAIATLEDYEAAGDRATPELVQRAKRAMLLLSGGAVDG